MSIHTQAETVRLDCVPAPTGSGLLLFPEGPVPLPIEHLKHRLFAWHEPSFYGTLLETTKNGPQDKDAILLPEAMSVHYLAHGIHDAAADVSFGPQLTAFIQAAPILLRCLEEGRFAPDYMAWHNGRTGWRLLLDEEEQAIWDGAVKEANHTGTGALVEEWPARLLHAWMGEDAGVMAAWEKLTAAYPLLEPNRTAEQSNETPFSQPAGLVADEEDWQVLTGWKRDEVPFRVALRLSEPGTMDADGESRESWVLDTVLLDRDDPSFRLLWQDWMEQKFVQTPSMAEEAQASLAGVPEGLPIPSSWLPG
ncbi:MAG: helicase, partial [Paenibacillaceae bacterium]|nr:helicase [Paenibacillaceae bacterium]